MKDFESKMPISRQIRYYKQSRDNWKENAAQKQIKIREYVQLTRALKKSRDNWKNKAMQAKKRAEEAEQKISELERKLKKLDPSYDSNPSEDEELSPPLSEKAPHHHYHITTISLKKELLFPDIFQNFLSDCHHCRKQILQTELAFAAPPSRSASIKN